MEIHFLGCRGQRGTLPRTRLSRSTSISNSGIFRNRPARNGSDDFSPEVLARKKPSDGLRMFALKRPVLATPVWRRGLVAAFSAAPQVVHHPNS